MADPIAVIPASEALAAGDYVNIWSSSGAKARKAGASTTGKEAHGYVLAAVASGANATVYGSGTNTAVAGMTPGPIFLSATTPGEGVAAAPTVAGGVVQRIGVAVSATAVNFEPDGAIVETTGSTTPIRPVALSSAGRLEQVADADMAELRTTVGAAAFDGSDALKVAGATSLARPQIVRRRDQLDLREFLDPNGVVATDAAFAALLAYANANPQITHWRGHAGDIFRFGTFGGRSLPARRWMFDGARIIWNSVYTGGGANLSFEGGHVEGLHLVAEAGASARRWIDFMGCKLRDVRVTSEQQAPYNIADGMITDSVVRLIDSGNDVDRLTIENCDKALLVYGTDGPGFASRDNILTNVVIRNYIHGIYVRNQKNLKLINPDIQGRSPAARDDAGNNGIICEGIDGLSLVGGFVADAGEHGIRFGGSRSGEAQSRNITVNGTRIYRSGQTGLKCLSATDGHTFENLNLIGLEIRDCQYEPERPSALPYFNDHGLMLEQVRGATIMGVDIGAELRDWSCSDGVYMADCQDVQMTGVKVNKAYRNGIRIAEFIDGTSSPRAPKSANSIYIRSCSSFGHRAEGILLDFPTQPIRDIEVTDTTLIGDTVSSPSYPAIRSLAQPPQYFQRCRFEVAHRGHSAAFDFPGPLPNVVLYDLNEQPASQVWVGSAILAAPHQQVDKFTANGTWTKPAWANRVLVKMVSGGSGGGSGALKASGVVAAGGGGGSGGMYAEVEYLASALPSTVAVTVGAGGAGAAAQSTADGNGAAGAVGATSTFGTYARASNVNNTAGGAGSTTAGAAGVSATSRYGVPALPNILGGAGGAGGAAAGGSGDVTPGGHPSGGGGVTAANAFSAGGSSARSAIGYRGVTSAANAGATIEGGTGATPANPTLAGILFGADGGPGGASSTIGNGGAGANGAVPGGGGGGGGAARNGFASGKGGDGARGEVWVVSMR